MCVSLVCLFDEAERPVWRSCPQVFISTAAVKPLTDSSPGIGGPTLTHCSDMCRKLMELLVIFTSLVEKESTAEWCPLTKFILPKSHFFQILECGCRLTMSLSKLLRPPQSICRTKQKVNYSQHLKLKSARFLHLVPSVLVADQLNRKYIIYISGLSLDHQTVSAVSRVRLSEREEESMSCFLRACDAALSYLQDLDKVSL